MKLFLIAITFFYTTNNFAWTLSRSARTGFKTTKSIDVYLGSDSCTNAGVTTAELLAYTKEAVDEFWNTVSTSSLKLNIKGITTTSLSSDDLNAAINKTPTNSIIVGCNSNATLFTSNNILAVGGMGCAGNDCRGAVIVNDKAGTVVASSDNQTIKATMAHELGHALGLGHTSVKYALMYYDATGVVNKSLAQDDIDGISYLYPNNKQLGGLAGSCSTVINRPGQLKDLFFGFLLGLFSILGLKFLKKRV